MTPTMTPMIEPIDTTRGCPRRAALIQPELEALLRNRAALASAMTSATPTIQRNNRQREAVEQVRKSNV
jgi:hypothetical protein